MRLTALVSILTAVLMYMPVSAQIITGKIIDKRSKPIAGATITLKVKGTSVTSDNTGLFSISGTGVTTPGSSVRLGRTFWLNGRNLHFYNEHTQMIAIDIFDINGKKTGATYSRTFAEGSFALPISATMLQKNARGLFVVRISSGTGIQTLPLNTLSGSANGGMVATSENNILAKRTVTPDSLIVSKTDYITVKKPIDSDVAQDCDTIILSLVNDPDAAIEKKVDSLLALMTIDEKIGQTTEAVVSVISQEDVKTKGYGSVFNGGGCPFSSNTKDAWKTNLDSYHDAASQSRLGIPILYGIDAVHGLATIEGATIFPHNIAMGCTQDTALVARMANITAKECRAVGINLNFGPAISVVRNEKWGRSYEGYGETPEINSLMAAAYVRGLQGYGNLANPDAVAACAKHFIGDGGTTNGVNGGVTNLSEATIRAVHLPPYQAAVSEMVASVMPSYNAWNRGGTEYRCTNDKFSIDILKAGLKFDGFCLSDWDAIPRAVGNGTNEVYNNENVGKALNAGIDMAMIAPNYTPSAQAKKISDYISCMKSLVPGTVAQARLDDAVRRILRIKFRMNLFAGTKGNASLLSEFGSASHRAVARECVRKSLVLLKNEDNALPLKTSDKVVVVGPWAGSMGAQCGGWTISWQGAVDNPTITGGTTILKGLQDAGGSNVTYDATGANLGSADKIVLVIGEGPYAEGQGDHGYKDDPTYIACSSCGQYNNSTMSINLADCPNRDLLAKCFATTKPVIVVLISGRPMIITQEIAKAKAFVAAWLPGSEGAGVADVLYKVGGANFTGKLTHTWPASMEQIPMNSGATYTDEPKGTGGTPLFPNGHGLSY